MKSLVLSNFDQPWLPSFALLLFLLVFISMLLMVFRPGSRNLYTEASELPLKDGGDHE